jgi:hypothetical protein
VINFFTKMDVEFFSDDPSTKARPRLEDLLSRGVDQLAIACAFCTAAGVQILLAHANELSHGNSFVVVAAAPPTDYAALSGLHGLIAGHLFVHWGMLSPVEKKAGAALMHSKVFYARRHDECWLWTGSHNLTGNATQAGNCEAAVLLHGKADEKPFVDALRHLEICRDQAALYDPDTPPPNGTERTDIIVIHAEADAIPEHALPWHVQLGLNTAQFDELLRLPAEVRLFLYPKNSLLGGWQNVTPIAGYSGSLTGQNLTDRNPRARLAGTPAEWRAAGFGIIEDAGVLAFGRDKPPGISVMTQAMINIDQLSDTNETLFSEAPKVEAKMLPGEQTLVPVDPDMRDFFRKRSVEGQTLIRLPVKERHLVIKVSAQDYRPTDKQKIQKYIAPERHLPVEIVEMPEQRLEKRHPFIVRAKYRLGRD